MYRELVDESYYFRWFHRFVSDCALFHRKPFKTLLYQCGASKETLIIFLEDQKGNILSRKISAERPDIIMLCAWLSEEFSSEGIELEKIEKLPTDSNGYYRED